MAAGSSCIVPSPAHRRPPSALSRQWGDASRVFGSRCQPSGLSGLVGIGNAVVEVYSVNGGLPGTQLGSPVSVPFALLTRGTVNTIQMLDANISVLAGFEYIITLGVSNPSDPMGVRIDLATAAPNTSMWFNGSSWNALANHLRIQSIITTDLWGQPIVTRTVNVAEGWNVVSVPSTTLSMYVDSLFPGHTSPAYGFDATYATKDTLHAGVGYWLKFPGPGSQTLTGWAVRPTDVTVAPGWNLIGPYEEDVAVASVTSTPPGLVLTPVLRICGWVHGCGDASQRERVLDEVRGVWHAPSSGGAPKPVEQPVPGFSRLAPHCC